MKKNIPDTEQFFNRELSWLEFNFRVLEEAGRQDNPLMERLKFIAISESNLDEFFMVRVAGLKQVAASSVNEIQMDGKTPYETLLSISDSVHHMVEMQYEYLHQITLQLKTYGIHLLDHFNQINEDEIPFIRDYFEKELFPVLTPFSVDPSHPFPHILSGRLNLAMSIHRNDLSEHNQSDNTNEPEGSHDKTTYALIEVPTIFPRFLELPRRNEKSELGQPVRRFIPLEEILKLHTPDLFPGSELISINGFTVIRNSDLSIDEVASDNLLSTIQDELKNRMWGEAVRLNFRNRMPSQVRDFLSQQLVLDDYELYERPGLLNLKDLWIIYNMCKDIPDLYDKPHIAKNAVPLEKTEHIFRTIRKSDILLHHPYDSFQTVVDFLQTAARDPRVLAIKQTLYRTSGDSPIVRSLIEAAENGKQVTALVELKARFDEENNIVWAREMEQHGIHVVYGLVGLKIHGKMLQVVRREDDGVRSYVHLATGNYNPITAKIYTDLGILTADTAINTDITRLFHALTGSSKVPDLKTIAAAPVNLRETVKNLINQEIENASAGKPARIRLKLNALVDSEMIQELYRASRAGVNIEMNIRGICCLIPQLKNKSENIHVYSIVGRYLEHSRIFYFENDGQPKIYLSSADLMPRNLNRRVEIIFPVSNPEHIERIIHILDIYAQDNHNCKELLPDGTYIRKEPESEDKRFSAQRYFREETNKDFEKKEQDRQERRKEIFQPIVNPDHE
jgi:polyphosphate kinase